MTQATAPVSITATICGQHPIVGGVRYYTCVNEKVHAIVEVKIHGGETRQWIHESQPCDGTCKRPTYVITGPAAKRVQDVLDGKNKPPTVRPPAPRPQSRPAHKQAPPHIPSGGATLKERTAVKSAT